MEKITLNAKLVACKRKYEWPGPLFHSTCQKHNRKHSRQFERLDARLVLDSTVVFNEVMYNPAGEDEMSEWIELHNQQAVDMDISGWRLDGGVRFDFPPGTIMPGGAHFVVASDPAALKSATGLDATVFGPFAGRLSNGGEELRLLDSFQSFYTRQTRSTPAALWSVDLQGVGGPDAPTRMSGADPNGLGDQWNVLDVSVHPGVATDPSIEDVLDSQGNSTGVGFFIDGTVSGFSRGSDRLLSDSIFVRAGNADPSISWRLTGLTSGNVYSLFAYGINERGREATMTVDFNGDGDLSDEQSFEFNRDGYLFEGVFADDSGTLVGDLTAGNWAGFHLFEGILAAPVLPDTVVPADNAGRRVMSTLRYDDSAPWPVASDGGEVSLAKIDPDGGTEWPSNWASSAQRGGTPGKENFSEVLVSNPIALNEVAASSTDSFQVEIYNVGDNPVELTGMVLTSVGADSEFVFPDQSLAPNEYLTMDQATLGFRPDTNEALILFTAGKSQFLDAVRLTDSLQGRSPDGYGRWLHPAQETWSASNQFDLEDGLVINEIMYNAYPVRTASTPYEENLEEWIELYNRRDDPISLSGWSLDGGIRFEFPPEIIVEPGQYLVVAKDAQLLREKYPDIANFIIGDFEGSLSNGGDTIILVDGRNNPADEVIYYDGGRWSSYADGGGSSLELIDVNADNSRAEAWSASEESDKSDWQQVQYQATAIDDGVGEDIWDELVLGLLNTGELLLDDISVVKDPDGFPSPLLQNGDFQQDALGTTPDRWRLVGNHGSHGHSVVVTDPDDPNNRVLHLVATGATRDVNNHAETTLVRPPDATPALPENVYSVDLQGVSGTAKTMNGRDDRTSLGRGLWNRLDVEDRGTATNPHIENLRNNSGQVGNIGFGFTGTISALVRGSDPLVDDSVFVRAGAADAMVSFEFTGLQPGEKYQFFPIGGRIVRREAQLTVDIDGDGDLTGEELFVIGPDGMFFENITASADGTIVGQFSNGNWAGFHLIEGELLAPLPQPSDAPIIQEGVDYQISFRAKWLGGSNQLNTRLYFNWLQRTTLLAVPTHNGTPGQVNSSYITNAGPTYDGFRHEPAVPDPGQPIAVTIMAQDPDEVNSMNLWYSVDGGHWASSEMVSNKSSVFVGIVPGQAEGANVQFYVEGQDMLGATTFYPARGPNSRAMFEVDDGRADLSRKHNVRIVMTPDDTSLLYRNTNLMSYDRLGATVIYDENTVFYDVGLRLKGSPHGRNIGTSLRGFNILFDPDHLFRGVHRTIAVERGLPKEMLANHFFSRASGGLVSYYDDLAHIITPVMSDTGNAMLSMSRLGDVYLDGQFENGSDGILYNMDLLFQPTTTVGNDEGFKLSWPTVNLLGPRVNLEFQDLGDDKETYRWSFQMRNNRGRDDYLALIDLGKAFELNGTELDERMAEIMDVDQWLRTFAMQTLDGHHDDYPGIAQHNFRAYLRPRDNKMVAMPWDLDGSFNRGSSDDLWTRNIRAAKLIEYPANLRAFYGHLWDMINTTFNIDYMQRWVDHYSELAGANFTKEAGYIRDRAAFVLGQLPEVIPFAISTSGGHNVATSDSSITLQGQGWIDVRDVRLDSRSTNLPLNWLDDQNWEVDIPLRQGENRLELTAYNHQGHMVGHDSIVVTTSQRHPSIDALRVTEVNYHPSEPTVEELEIAPGLDKNDFEFLEFRNVGDQPLDLGGVKINTGVLFAFPTVELAPGEYGVVVKDLDAFTIRYGQSERVLGVFESGNLANGGEIIEVLTVSGELIQRFEFSDVWYRSSDGGGTTLEIVNPQDPVADNWSVLESWRPSARHGGTPGIDATSADFDGNGAIDSVDIDLLFAHINDGANSPQFDLTNNGTVDEGDVDDLVLNILGTQFGDTNLDGSVDFKDFIKLSNQFNKPGGWADGDSDGDGEIGFRDFTLLTNQFGFVRR